MRQLTVLFLKKDRRVLLAMKKRGFGAGRWNGVGGKIEPGESIEQAMLRECHEEIKVTPTQTSKYAELVFDQRHQGTPEKLKIHVFVSTAWDGEPQETEEMSPRWFNISNLPFDDMWADDIYWLAKVLDGKLLRAKFTLDKNDQVVEHNVREVANL